jgi:hypothetical protein
MIRQYNLTDFQDVNDFLSKMAMKMGSLKKGGAPDIHKAAQRVLSDWTNGKLTYFTEPPERTNEIISTELVTQMREAFDIDALLNNEDEQLEELQHTPITEISLSSSIPTQVDHEMSDEESMSDSENSTAEARQSITKDSTEVFEKSYLFSDFLCRLF